MWWGRRWAPASRRSRRSRSSSARPVPTTRPARRMPASIRVTTRGRRGSERWACGGGGSSRWPLPTGPGVGAGPTAPPTTPSPPPPSPPGPRRGLPPSARDPREPGAEVVLHLAHEGGGMDAEIELRPLLGRDDGFPEAGVAGRLPRAEGRGEVKVVLARGEAEPALAGPLGAIPRQISAVGPPGAGAPVANIGDLDDAPSPVRPHADDDTGAAGAVARGGLTPAAEPRPPGQTPRRTGTSRGRHSSDVEAEGVGVTHGS